MVVPRGFVLSPIECEINFMKRSLLLALCVALLSAGARRAVSAEAKPNILIILTDDQGYHDADFMGGTDVSTPNLDALAKSGVFCTNGYVSHPFCSPSRAGLLTGRYQQRFGHEFNPVYDPLDKTEGLPLTERLLPQALKQAGLTTGWIGKWHLGSSSEHSPWSRGFDETFGFIGGGHRFWGWKPNGRQYTLPITRQGKPLDGVERHLTTVLGEEAAAYIRRHQAEPWFLFLAFTAPHTPHEPTPERLARFASISSPQRRRLVAQISLLDDAIGDVLKALDDTAQTQNTLVFYCSDNGGPVTAGGANNTPLRGQKGQLYEGGVRVPFVVRWPAKFPAGTKYDQPVSALDFYATSLAATGVTMPTGKKYDSVNLIPYLAGENKAAPHERLFWRAGGGKIHALREGRWKLVRLENKPAELYDLESDLAESHDLAQQRPDLTARLTTTLDTWNRELIPPVFLGSSVKNEDWGPGGANQPAAKKKAGGK
jgi:arylsulfatase A-like enzyme